MKRQNKRNTKIKKQKSKLRRYIPFLGIGIFFSALLIASGQPFSHRTRLTEGMPFIANAQSEDTICQGVFLDMVDVGGMTRQQAVSAYQDYIKNMDSLTITLTSSEGEYEIPLSALNIRVDIENAVEEALSYGRKGNILSRYKEIRILENESVTLVPKKEWDDQILEDKLTNDAWALMKQAKNASVERVNGEFIVYAGEDGVTLMTDRTIASIEEVFKEVWKSESLILPAVTEVTHPQYTEEDFYGIDSLLGRCSTEYNSRVPERIQNLTVGASKIADSVVLPGEQFSVYQTVAPFTEENGYGNAGQYVNDELVDGLGGGICQVATTLYDAVLEAELQVDERYPHSMTVSYVDKGMDAAIAEGYEDFCFTNNTSYPIYIDAYAGGGMLSVAIYGHETRSSDRKIQFESQVLEEYEPGEEQTIYDDTLPSGQERITDAHKGYYVEVWKHIYIDGELTDSVKVNGSQYNAVSKKTRIGTGTEE